MDDSIESINHHESINGLRCWAHHYLPQSIIYVSFLLSLYLVQAPHQLK